MGAAQRNLCTNSASGVDIDLCLAIADERCATVNNQRRAFVARFGEPLLVQEGPQNAPPGGTFLLVLYRGTGLPLQEDWSWQPASTARIPEHAPVLFDRAGLPRSSSWHNLSPAEVVQGVSLATTFFWAMASIATKKILRRQPAAFDLLRLMQQAQDRLRALLRGDLLPVWGAIAIPATVETHPPVESDAQLLYLESLLETLAAQLRPDRTAAPPHGRQLGLHRGQGRRGGGPRWRVPMVITVNTGPASARQATSTPAHAPLGRPRRASAHATPTAMQTPAPPVRSGWQDGREFPPRHPMDEHWGRLPGHHVYPGCPAPGLSGNLAQGGDACMSCS